MSSCERYNLKTSKWEKIASLNSKRCTASSIVSNGQLFVLGGYHGTGRGREIERYNEIENRWEIIDLALKHPIEASLLFTLSENDIILLGGKDQYNQTNYATIYDLANNTIREGPSMPASHILAKGARYGNRLICYGGSTNSQFNVLDLPSSSWYSIPVPEFVENKILGRISSGQGR